MKKEKKNYTCKFSPKNEYIGRYLNASNGLWDALVSMKEGDSAKYKDYFTKITNGRTCPESTIEFWSKQLKSSQSINGKQSPRAILHRNTVGSGKSMNLDHSKLIDGDIFLVDGNHRITIAMMRGEEPIVAFDDRINLSLEWKDVINAKTNTTHRVKHQPHPHPLLWDLTPYRNMQSCEERYGALAKAGIKSTYEIGCAEGVGIWILRQLGVEANGGELNGPARTLAMSLLKDTIDPQVLPDTLPKTECLVMYSVLYHLLGGSKKDEWLQKIKEYQCVALELSTAEEDENKDRYHHMKKYKPLDWWPNRKLLYIDPKHANRETWLLWK